MSRAKLGHIPFGFFTALWILTMASTPATGQSAPDGESLYRQHCARCHEGEMPTIMLQGSIRDMPADRVFEAINFFFMQRYAGSMTQAEKRAVAEFVAGDPPESLQPALEQIPRSAYCGSSTVVGNPLAAPGWNGWSPDPSNSRFQSVTNGGVTATDLPELQLKWAFGFPGVLTTSFQATVVGGRVFVGTSIGLVYGLDAESGCVYWVHEADAAVRAAVSIGPGANGQTNVYFGDVAANMYAVDFGSGERRWKIKVDDHLDARITGAPALHDGRLYVPLASGEEGTAAWPGYECCTFRGSVVALDTQTGSQVWKTYMIDEEPRRTDTNAAGAQRWAPSGIGIWSTPTLDPSRGVLYVATGDNYSQPATSNSDAIMALSMDTGEVGWVNQITPGDAWNAGCMGADEPSRAGCPEDSGPDFDFGSSPILTTMPNGARVLLVGQKSGVLYGLNADTGETLWERRVADGGIIGGLEWGMALAGDVVYASISDTFEKAPGVAGGLAAVGTTDGEVVWEAPPFQDTCGSKAGCHTGQPAAVTTIPGAVISGSLDGYVRAYASDTGDVIWDFDTAREFSTVNGVPGRGGALNGPGPTVAGGMLFVASGYANLGFMPGNVLLVFSVDGR